MIYLSFKHRDCQRDAYSASASSAAERTYSVDGDTIVGTCQCNSREYCTDISTTNLHSFIVEQCFV